MAVNSGKVKFDSLSVLTNKIQCITWNVHGLRKGTKKHKILAHLKSLSSDVVFLQELHFKKGEIE